VEVSPEASGMPIVRGMVFKSNLTPLDVQAREAEFHSKCQKTLV